METAEHFRVVRARIRPELLKQLKQIGIDKDKSMQALIVEGLEMMLMMYGKKKRKSK